jgi:hypothetical protein
MSSALLSVLLQLQRDHSSFILIGPHTEHLVRMSGGNQTVCPTLKKLNYTITNL